MSKRVMIVEDDSSTRQLLAEIVRTLDCESEIIEFSSIDGVYEVAMNTHIDLFLLDIILDTGNKCDTSGMQLATKLRTVSQYEFVPIIFVTSLEDGTFYAYRKLHSFGYIEKPFKIDEIKRIISDALRFSELQETDNTLFLRVNGIIYAVKASEILYVETAMRKLYVYKTNGEEMIVSYKTIKQIMEEIDNDSFIQCGRTTLVNKKHIEYVDVANKIIKMKGLSKPVVIGRSFEKNVYKEFNYGQ